MAKIRRRDEGCCSVEFVKYVLHVFNVLFLDVQVESFSVKTVRVEKKAPTHGHVSAYSALSAWFRALFSAACIVFTSQHTKRHSHAVLERSDANRSTDARHLSSSSSVLFLCSDSFCRERFHQYHEVTGLGVLGIGLWTILDKYQYVTLLTSLTYPMLTYFLLAAGGLVLLVAILGFCAGCWEHRPLLICYMFLLILIFLMEAMVGVFGFIYQEIVHTELENNLNSTFLTHYKVDNDKTVAIDFLQEKFQCCGAVSFSDWQYSQWKVKNPGEINLVPDSCCKTIKGHCGRRDHPSNINYSGCLQKMEDHLRNHLSILSAVGLGICVIQVFGVVYACMLFVKLKDLEDDT